MLFCRILQRAIPLLALCLFPSILEAQNQQILHASPDPFVDSLVFWSNTQGIGGRITRMYPPGSNTYSPLKYQNASPMILSPIHLSFSIANVLTTTSTSTFASFQLNFPLVGNSILVMSGVVSTSGYAPNPDGRSIILRPFVSLTTNGTFSTINGSGIGFPQFAFFHGCTDAPALDVVVRGLGVVASNIKYGDFSPYFPLPRANYILDLRAAGTSTTLASFSANFQSDFVLKVGDRLTNPRPAPIGSGPPYIAAISGFLNPQNNRGSMVNRLPPPIEIFITYSFFGQRSPLDPDNPEKIIPIPGNPVGKLPPLPLATSILTREQTPKGSGIDIPFARFDANTKQCIAEIILSSSGMVRSWISDIRGGKVLGEQQNYYLQGSNTIFFDASSLPSGMYFIVIQSDNSKKTAKVLVVQ